MNCKCLRKASSHSASSSAQSVPKMMSLSCRPLDDCTVTTRFNCEIPKYRNIEISKENWREEFLLDIEQNRTLPIRRRERNRREEKRREEKEQRKDIAILQRCQGEVKSTLVDFWCIFFSRRIFQLLPHPVVGEKLPANRGSKSGCHP